MFLPNKTAKTVLRRAPSPQTLPPQGPDKTHRKKTHLETANRQVTVKQRFCLSSHGRAHARTSRKSTIKTQCFWSPALWPLKNIFFATKCPPRKAGILLLMPSGWSRPEHLRCGGVYLANRFGRGNMLQECGTVWNFKHCCYLEASFAIETTVIFLSKDWILKIKRAKFNRS